MYSLYQLEVLLSEMFGRPMCIHTNDFTVDIPPSDQWEQTPGHGASADSISGRSASVWRSFLGIHRGVALNLTGGVIDWDRFVPVLSNFSPQHFTTRLALSEISEEIGAKMYTRRTETTWFAYQHETRALNEKLLSWRASLPSELQIDFADHALHDPRSRLELAMYHDCVTMLLWRPYLCELVIDGESMSSASFNKEGARTCVQAALHMIDTMPDAPVRAEIFQILPWWSLLHYICQASAVLLLELSLDMQHMQEGTTTVMLALKKAISCLAILAQHAKSAYKGWKLVRCLADKVLQRYTTDIFSDVPMVALRPWNWDDGNEAILDVVVQTLR